MNVLKLSDFSEKIQKGFIENEEINVNEVKRIINENFKKSLISEELFCDSMDIVDSFEKARKKAEIGEVRNFGGRDYVKTTNGWKYKRKDSEKTTSSKTETKKDATPSNRRQKQSEKFFTTNYREEMVVDEEVKSIVEKEAKRVNSTPEAVFKTLFDLVDDELMAVKEESGTEDPIISLNTVKELLQAFELNDLSI